MIDMTQLNTWSVNSSSQPGVAHTVRRYPISEVGEETWVCSCRAWYYRHTKVSHYQCRHIKEVITALMDAYSARLNGSYDS